MAKKPPPLPKPKIPVAGPLFAEAPPVREGDDIVIEDRQIIDITRTPVPRKVRLIAQRKQGAKVAWTPRTGFVVFAMSVNDPSRRVFGFREDKHDPTLSYRCMVGLDDE